MLKDETHNPAHYQLESFEEREYITDLLENALMGHPDFEDNFIALSARVAVLHKALITPLTDKE